MTPRNEDGFFDRIKKLVVIAMFSDDLLMDEFVLKGGNALDLIHRISTRASVDVDLSIGGEFPGGSDELIRRARAALTTTFAEAGYGVIDVRIADRPKALSADVADFWGGYRIEFKLIELDRAAELEGDEERLRRNAINLGQGTRFFIDISRNEYIDGKEMRELEGYVVFVYSPVMMVCEKLRAICQQMPEYEAVVHRGRPGAPRARDFLDVHAIVTRFAVSLQQPDNEEVLRQIFLAKRVPLRLLRGIEQYRDFHRADFEAVRQTVRPDTKLETFDFYFDFVVSLVQELKPLWDI
jgi:Nucleotidyl transferase AbiEii toxin, Type IV TA system